MTSSPSVFATALLLLVGATGLATGQEPSSLETATFSMYCYWTGEATVGRVDGVVASRIGHWAGKEIVQVDYDPALTDLDTLVRALESRSSFYAVVVDRAATDGGDEGEFAVSRLRGEPRFIEPKYSLRRRHPELYALDLTEQQAIALNSWSHFGGPMPDVLTVEQKQMLAAR